MYNGSISNLMEWFSTRAPAFLYQSLVIPSGHQTYTVSPFDTMAVTKSRTCCSIPPGLPEFNVYSIFIFRKLLQYNPVKYQLFHLSYFVLQLLFSLSL